MSKKAEEYRRKAEEAEEMALRSVDASTHEIYNEVAKKWRKLAEQAERRGE